LQKAMRDTEIVRKLDDLGVKVVGSTQPEALRYYRADFEMTSRLVKAAGLKPE
jgi:hypothetical protein